MSAIIMSAIMKPFDTKTSTNCQLFRVAVHGIFFNLPKIGLLSTGKKEYS